MCAMHIGTHQYQLWDIVMIVKENVLEQVVQQLKIQHVHMEVTQITMIIQMIIHVQKQEHVINVEK